MVQLAENNSQAQTPEKANLPDAFGLDKPQLNQALGVLGFTAESQNGQIVFRDHDGQVVEVNIDEVHGTKINGKLFPIEYLSVNQYADAAQYQTARSTTRCP